MINIATVSLGCPKNTVDSEVMLGKLGEKGFNITNEPEIAEVIIINTCGFIESAKKESIDTILEFAKYKENKCQVLVVTGCLVQRYKEELKEEIPEIDGIMGTGEYEKIADCIDAGLEGTNFDRTEKLDYLYDHTTPRMLSTPKHTAYVKIAEGCDNHCTYCIIPKLRGGYRSRPIESIVEEVENLVKGGVKEVILVAQDTTVYGMDIYGEYKLADLLTKLNSVDKLRWIRVMYCYPTYLSDTLLETFSKLDKVVKYIDLPLQHGDDQILKKMGRKEKVSELKGLVKKIRSYMPDVAIRTSLIVGFPGETDENFENLMEFVKTIKLDRVGVFTYSSEEGTPAHTYPNKVSKRKKVLRQHRLMKAQRKISKEINEKWVGQTIDVLIESIDNGNLIGRSFRDSPQIDGNIIIPKKGRGNELIGEIFPVKITEAFDYDLLGEFDYESSK
ncbi:30S ribosomal protein S12 methylthiotransferase RimO [Proteinivorax hydrogeniformans]|uniref:Ribosomal protein uS12 methylthiotransferase RimO n=1 Tax=Proteinivorax hydrogeniformans TaxID=1826727 RepID=A0AAU8HQA9_9FIRM